MLFTEICDDLLNYIIFFLDTKNIFNLIKSSSLILDCLNKTSLKKKKLYLSIKRKNLDKIDKIFDFYFIFTEEIKISNLNIFSNLHTLHLINCHTIIDASPLGYLHKLNLTNCKNLTDVNGLSKVHDLDLSNCINIKNVEKLGNVHKLNLSGCVNLNEDSLKFLSNIYELILNNTNNLVTDLNTIYGNKNNLMYLKNIYKLSLFQCNNFENTNFLTDIYDLDLSKTNVKKVNKLQAYRLNLSNCKNIENVNNIDNRDYLNLSGCINIKNIDNIKNINHLNISNTNILNINNLKYINYLNISDTKISDVSKLDYCNVIVMRNCKNITDISNLNNVNCLDFSYSVNIKKFNELMNNNKIILTHLNIENLSIFKNVKSIQISHIKDLIDVSKLEKVEELKLQYCLNIKGLKELKYLKKLNIYAAKNITLEDLLNFKYIDEIYIDRKKLAELKLEENGFNNIKTLDFPNILF